MNAPTYAEMIEQARQWPRDGFGEGRWFNAMADEMERLSAIARAAVRMDNALCEFGTAEPDYIAEAAQDLHDVLHRNREPDQLIGGT